MLFALVLLQAPPPPPLKSEPLPALVTRLEELVPAVLDAERVPGVAIALLRAEGEEEGERGELHRDPM